jgi:hypothetical protein
VATRVRRDGYVACAVASGSAVSAVWAAAASANARERRDVLRDGGHVDGLDRQPAAAERVGEAPRDDRVGHRLLGDVELDVETPSIADVGSTVDDDSHPVLQEARTRF